MNICHSKNSEDENFIYFWGTDFHGQTGLEKNAHNKTILVPTKFNFKYNIRMISFGESHSAFINSNGKVFTMGNNKDGKLGIGKPEVIQILSPCLVSDLAEIEAKSISCGKSHSTVVMKNGQIYSWGDGEEGALGIGSKVPQWSPIKMKFKGSFIPNLFMVSCGKVHTLILDISGNLYGCGNSKYGQLGTGREDSEYYPVKIKTSEEIIYIACGNFHSLLLSKSNHVYCIGNNDSGQLGIGTKENKSIPFLVDNLIDIKNIEASNYSSALSFSNKMYIWGTGSFGEYLYPTEAFYFPIKKYSIGINSGIAQDFENNLFSWGSNKNGELGQGDREQRIYPSKILNFPKIESEILAITNLFAMAICSKNKNPTEFRIPVSVSDRTRKKIESIYSSEQINANAKKKRLEAEKNALNKCNLNLNLNSNEKKFPSGRIKKENKRPISRQEKENFDQIFDYETQKNQSNQLNHLNFNTKNRELLLNSLKSTNEYYCNKNQNLNLNTNKNTQICHYHSKGKGCHDNLKQIFEPNLQRNSYMGPLLRTKTKTKTPSSTRNANIRPLRNIYDINKPNLTEDKYMNSITKNYQNYNKSPFNRNYNCIKKEHEQEKNISSFDLEKRRVSNFNLQMRSRDSEVKNLKNEECLFYHSCDIDKLVQAQTTKAKINSYLKDQFKNTSENKNTNEIHDSIKFPDTKLSSQNLNNDLNIFNINSNSSIQELKELKEKNKLLEEKVAEMEIKKSEMFKEIDGKNFEIVNLKENISKKLEYIKDQNHKIEIIEIEKQKCLHSIGMLNLPGHANSLILELNNEIDNLKEENLLINENFQREKIILQETIELLKSENNELEKGIKLNEYQHRNDSDYSKININIKNINSCFEVIFSNMINIIPSNIQPFSKTILKSVENTNQLISKRKSGENTLNLITTKHDCNTHNSFSSEIDAQTTNSNASKNVC